MPLPKEAANLIFSHGLHATNNTNRFMSVQRVKHFARHLDACVDDRREVHGALQCTDFKPARPEFIPPKEPPMRLIPALALLIATSTQASVIGIVTADGGSSIRITREQGPCLGDARLAQWVSRDALTVVPGCWITDGRMVYISFLDGDRADVPVPMLKAPTSL